MLSLNQTDGNQWLKNVCCQLWTLVLKQDSVTLSFWIEQRSLNRTEALGTVVGQACPIIPYCLPNFISDGKVQASPYALNKELAEVGHIGMTVMTKRLTNDNVPIQPTSTNFLFRVHLTICETWNLSLWLNMGLLHHMHSRRSLPN